MAEAATELLHPSKPPTPSAKDQKTSASFLSSSLYKAIVFVLVVALLPLFPSEAPQFMNRNISTRSWELIHLLVVGIAISYGLFSRRNTEPDMEKEAQHSNKAVDGPQSYFSQVLRDGSTVFDDDDEVESPCDDYKTLISSSQYYRSEPLVVVDSESGSAADGRDADRPLCLPVRSLKSHSEGSGKLDEAQKNSARMEMKISTFTTIAAAPSRNLSFAEESAPSKDQSFRDGAHSPIRQSPSPERKEMRGKSNEDRVKKKSFYPPPPPPHQPPPPLFTNHGYHYNLDKKLETPSFTDELKDSGRTKPSKITETSTVGRSVRTVRSNQNFHFADPESPPEAAPEPLPMNGFMDKAVIVSDEDSDSEGDDGVVVSSIDKEVPSSATTAAANQGDENEVDKKADEFIAKFREQIRLQRIASIKRSANQRSSSRSNKSTVN